MVAKELHYYDHYKCIAYRGILLYSTLTNVNFDPDRFLEYIAEGVALRERLREQYEEACNKKGVSPKQFRDPAASWLPANGMMSNVEAMEEEGL